MTEHEIVNFLNQQYNDNSINISEYSINEMLKNTEIKEFLKDLIFYNTIETLKKEKPKLLDVPFKDLGSSDLVAMGMSTSQHINNIWNIYELNSK